MSLAKQYSKEERKINGVFYTPTFLAEYLAKKIVYYWGKTKSISEVLDPGCGGSILLQCFANEILLNKRIKSLPKIVGIDKDINAVIGSTKIFANKPLKQFTTKFINTDGLFPAKDKDSVNGWINLRREIDCQDGFDISLSNPPWGADLNIYDLLTLNHNFTLAKGQFDIYDLFIEIILNNLKDGGIYGLILPDSVFSQEQSRLRVLLTTNTTIHLIARLGEKIFSEINRACIIIIGRKTKAQSDHAVDCFRLSSNYKKKVLSNELALEDAEKELSHKVPQRRFIENDKCIFDIDLKTEEEKTFDKIQNTGILFKNIVMNMRGAEISKKGIVCQCQKCRHWMPYPRAKKPKCTHCNSSLNLDNIKTDKIIMNRNGVGNAKLKVGEDLYRYTSISKSWINTHKKGINYKDISIYQGGKILVRKTGVGITASIDYNNSITNQVVYILKLKPTYNKKLSIEFVLAVLNSRAITYYLIKKYGENEWKSHPYLTQTILVNLPFPKIDFNSKVDRNLISKVTNTIKSEVVSSKEKNISKANDLIIERVVAYFFKLKRKDYKVIFETLSSAQQLIPIKRLLNCDYREIFKDNGF
ncbi:MAG: N-6 DNA methylase [Proteobacteria bacterium]|nr:N-6 DNA methylase [Pseudomonadota bacterium]